IAQKRWKRSLYARPQAWCTPIGLLAVMGPSRKLQRSLPAFWARRRANVWRSRHRARISFSWATRSGLELTVRHIVLGASRQAVDSTFPSPDSCLHDGEGNLYRQSYRTYGVEAPTGAGQDGPPHSRSRARAPPADPLDGVRPRSSL